LDPKIKHLYDNQISKLTGVSITAHREAASKEAENSTLLNNHEINFVLQLQHQTAPVSIKFSGIMDKLNAFYTTILTLVQQS
jgi:hypothetical protein